MRELVRGYWMDVAPYLAWSFSDWFDFVRRIPYESDEQRFPSRVLEVVSRPAYLLDRNLFPRLDCKKKAILIASWAYGNGVPYRFVAVSQRPSKEVHHVFPQIKSGSTWVNADATFPDFSLGQGQPVTYAAELV